MFRIRCSGGRPTRTTLRAGSSSMLAANSRKLRERYGRFDPANPGKRQAIPRSRCWAAMLKARSSGRAIFNRAGSRKNSTSSCSLSRRARMASMPRFSASAGSIAWSDRSMTFNCGKFFTQQRQRGRIAVKHALLLQPAWSSEERSEWNNFLRLARSMSINPQPEPARGIDQNQQPRCVRRVGDAKQLLLYLRSHRGNLPFQ